MSRLNCTGVVFSMACVALFLLVAVPPTRAGWEGPMDTGSEGADWEMEYVDPAHPPAGWNTAVLVPYNDVDLRYSAPDFEYHWWLGCSPTAAGMLFAYWDTRLDLDKSTLYTFGDGNSAYWDDSHMNENYQSNYGRNGVYPTAATHSIVASWEHKQAGVAKGISHGSWDRNGNDVVDQSDRDDWNCLADFMKTEGGGTYRGNMAQGFIDYAAWNDPETPLNESYSARSWTDWSENWNEYKAEIDAHYPLHTGISGHSILGVGYWTDPEGEYGEPGEHYVVNMTTWGGSNNKYGLVKFDAVYAYTYLHVEEAAVPPNHEPVALDDPMTQYAADYSSDEDYPIHIHAYNGVLANDSDPDDDELGAECVSDPSHGTVSLNDNGSFTYTPDDNYFGTDSFTYVANDGILNSDVATVTLEIASVNDIPIAEEDFYSIDLDEDDVLNIYAHAGVLSNDTDVESELDAILRSDVLYGDLSLYTNGSFTYRPDAGFSGLDTFGYEAFDGEAYSDLTTVMIEVLESSVILIPGDADGDGKVNEVDASILADNWGQTGATWTMGDFDGNGVIGPGDAAILAANWGYDAGEAGSAAVPEPSALGLLLTLAIATVGFLRRRPRLAGRR